MRTNGLRLFIVVSILCVAWPSSGQVPEGWEKVSGTPETGPFSGVPDGLAPGADRQNSYSWSMDTLNGYLYVGTARNAFSLTLAWLVASPLP